MGTSNTHSSTLQTEGLKLNTKAWNTVESTVFSRVQEARTTVPVTHPQCMQYANAFCARFITSPHRLLSGVNLSTVSSRMISRRRVPASDEDAEPTLRAKRARVAGRVINGQMTESQREAGSSATQGTAQHHYKVNGKGRGMAKQEPIAVYPQRATSLWKVGAHISAAGGVENAVVNAASIGANAFALFIKSQRKWESPPLTDASILAFKTRLKEFGYEARNVVPHGSYLINLGNPDEGKRDKSYECFLDDLKRCEQLGLELYNFHPGSTVGAATKQDSISHIATCINRAHKATSSVITLIENMAGSGNTIGSTFSDLAGIINLVHDKNRIGVCLDTCHMFAAGYDIRTKDDWELAMLDFDTQVGLSYLRAMHLNDSKKHLGSKRDLHENIGLGYLGLTTFHHIVTDRRTQNLPLILETPSFEKTEVWAKEVEVLNRISGVGLADGERLGWEEQIREVVKKASGGNAAKGGPSNKPKRTRTKLEKV